MMDDAAAPTPEGGARLDPFFLRSPDLLAVVGLDGLIEAASPSWQDQLGVRPDEIVETRFFDLLHPEDAQGLSILGETGRGDVSLLFDARARENDGGYRWYRWSARLGDSTTGAAGFKTALYLHGTDVDEVRQAEREQREQTEIADALAKLDEAAKRGFRIGRG